MKHYIVYIYTEEIKTESHVDPVIGQGFPSKAEAYEFVERTLNEHPNWIPFIYEWDLDKVRVY